MIIVVVLSLQLEFVFAMHPSMLVDSETHKYVFVVLLEYLKPLYCGGMGSVVPSKCTTAAREAGLSSEGSRIK